MAQWSKTWSRAFTRGERAAWYSVDAAYSSTSVAPKTALLNTPTRRRERRRR
jgi:hypothetical protein